MADRACTIDGCDRGGKIARGLCSPHYQAAWKTGSLPPIPAKPAPRHVCERHQPSSTCYVGCGCRCQDCRDIRAAYSRERGRAIAYGRFDPFVDAEPARLHVRSLMAAKPGTTNGVGLKQIVKVSGVAQGTLWKLMYGKDGKTSERIRRETADRLLAVTRDDAADGSTVAAAPTRRKLEAMVAGGFARAELGRYLTGDVRTRSLQVGGGRRVTVAHRRQVDELYARWKAGEIEPVGRWARGRGDPPVTPRETGALRLGIVRETCEDCGVPSLSSGRWCWPCFRARSTGVVPTGCGTDAGYTAHRRRGEPPCAACREGHALATDLRRAAS